MVESAKNFHALIFNIISQAVILQVIRVFEQVGPCHELTVGITDTTANSILDNELLWEKNCLCLSCLSGIQHKPILLIPAFPGTPGVYSPCLSHCEFLESIDTTGREL